MKSLSLLLTFLTLSLSGCFSKSEKEAPGEQVFNARLREQVNTLDPAISYDEVSLDIVPNIFETLYQYDYTARPDQIVPLLAADKPTISKDRLTVTIPIRRGIKYQDDPAFKNTNGKGRELRARDFVLAWKRLADPRLKSPGWWIFEGKIKGASEWRERFLNAPAEERSAAFKAPIAGLQALDDYTLRIALEKPYPQLLYVLAMAFTAPIAHEVLDAYKNEEGALHEHPVGTGPFMLQEWVRGSKVVLVRNPNAHSDFYPMTGHKFYREQGLLEDAGKPLPFVSKVVYTILPEEQPAWLKFLNGELDYIRIPKDSFDVAMTDLTTLSPELKEKGIQLFIDDGYTYYFLGFNMKDPLVGANKYLRQAMGSAIDREKFINLFANGRGEQMTHLLPPQVVGRNKNARLKYDFNLDRAKALLKKAGYAEGKDLPPIRLDLRGSDTLSRQLGDFLTQSMAQIGVQLQVIYNTFPAYLEKAKNGQFQAYYGGWTMDYPDAENALQLLYGPNSSPGPNESNLDDPQYNALYEKIAIQEPGPSRTSSIQKMDEWIQELQPWSYIYNRKDYALTQPWVKNFRIPGFINNRFKYLRIDLDVKKRMKR